MVYSKILYCINLNYFNISYINLPPYDSVDLGVGKSIQEIVIKCFGTCAKYEEINYFSNITELSPSSINSSDFVYPLLATATTKRLYGFYYLPVIDIPKAMYITRAGEEKTLFEPFASCIP